MPQQQQRTHTFSNGLTVVIPPGSDEAAVKARIAAIEEQLHPSADNRNSVQKFLDNIGEALKMGVITPGMPIGTKPPAALDSVAQMGRNGTAGLIDTASHPLQNAPAIGAMIGQAAGAYAAPEINFIDALVRAGMSTLGGGAGAAVRGDTAEQIPITALGQGALNAFAGEVPAGIGRGIVSPLARRFASASVGPSDKVLASLINPTTQMPFRNAEEAIKYFRSQVFEVAPGYRPGGGAYANAIDDSIAAARLKKEAALKAATLQKGPNAPSIDPAVAVKGPRGDMLKLTNRALNSGEAGPDLKAASEAVQAAQERLIPDIDPATGQPRLLMNGMPATTPHPNPIQPYTPLEADAKIQGLDDKLATAYAQQKMLRMAGGNPPLDFASQARQAMRANLADELSAQVPAIDAPNAFMSERIPFRNAAKEATFPRGNDVPRLRLSGGVSAPKFQLFEYLGGNRLSQPLKGIGQGMQSPTAIPNLVRLATFLSNSDAGNRGPE